MPPSKLVDFELLPVSGAIVCWKNESFIKQQGSRFNTVARAAGELFSIRTELFRNARSGKIIWSLQLYFQILNSYSNPTFVRNIKHLSFCRYIIQSH